MWIIRALAWHFRAQLLIAGAAFGADAAWNFAGAFWGFTILALSMAQFGCWMASNASHASTKAQQLQQRVDTVVIPRLPFPQPTTGPGGNSSFGPSNSSFTSGNSSFSIGNSTFNDNSTTDGWQTGGRAAYNVLRDNYSSMVPAFNAMRTTVSDLVAAYNAHIGDHGNLVNTVSTLRASYSSTVTDHNNVVTALQNANVLH